MNLGFDAISQFPISQVAADDKVTVIINGNNLTLSIGPVNVAADAVQEQTTGDNFVLGIGTVSIVATGNVEAPKTPLTLGTGNVTVSGNADLEASGNNLIIRSGSVTIVGTASIEAPATAMTLGTGEVGIITWNEIIPGATMVWTPIKPY